MAIPPILVSFDANEAHRTRAQKLKEAIAKDERFILIRPGNHPFDLKFQTLHSFEAEDGPRSMMVTLYVELKDFTGDGNSDYLRSIQNDHLWEQVLSGRELGTPLALVILGDDRDVTKAVRKAAGYESHTIDLKKFLSYSNMVEGFEANCIALGVPVWRLKDNPWERLLLRVRKILEGGNLDGFRPQPAENERQAVALSILAGRGIGPEKARSILEKFEIQLWPKGEDFGYCPPVLEDCKGIGPKLADTVRQNLKVMEVGCE